MYGKFIGLSCTIVYDQPRPFIEGRVHRKEINLNYCIKTAVKIEWRVLFARAKWLIAVCYPNLGEILMTVVVTDDRSGGDVAQLVRASDRHAADAGSIPLCGKGFFSQSQL